MIMVGVAGTTLEMFGGDARFCALHPQVRE